MTCFIVICWLVYTHDRSRTKNLYRCAMSPLRDDSHRPFIYWSNHTPTLDQSRLVKLVYFNTPTHTHTLSLWCNLTRTHTHEQRASTKSQIGHVRNTPLSKHRNDQLCIEWVLVIFVYNSCPTLCLLVTVRVPKDGDILCIPFDVNLYMHFVKCIKQYSQRSSLADNFAHTASPPFSLYIPACTDHSCPYLSPLSLSSCKLPSLQFFPVDYIFLEIHFMYIIRTYICIFYFPSIHLQCVIMIASLLFSLIEFN